MSFMVETDINEAQQHEDSNRFNLHVRFSKQIKMHVTESLHFPPRLNGAFAFQHHCILHLFSCGRVIHYSMSSIRKALSAAFLSDKDCMG